MIVGFLTNLRGATPKMLGAPASVTPSLNSGRFWIFHGRSVESDELRDNSPFTQIYWVHAYSHYLSIHVCTEMNIHNILVTITGRRWNASFPIEATHWYSLICQQNMNSTFLSFLKAHNWYSHSANFRSEASGSRVWIENIKLEHLPPLHAMSNRK